MSLPKGRDHWSKEDIVELLERMENNLPSKDSHTFKTTQSQMDWDKVAFKDFSGEMCKLKWLEISYNLRKFRTLAELVLEAKERVKNPYKSKKCKKHPDLPTKPLTAYLRFFKEKRPQFSHMYPELSSRKLTTLLSETYKELPEQMKRKYTQDFQKEKREFEEKLAQFREDHPDLVQNSKESGVPKKRQTTAQKKVQRNEQAAKSLPENFSKNMKFHGEPPKPPMNGYHKFYQDLWASRELRDVPLRERMVAIGRCWQRVPQRQKALYKEQAEELQRRYRTDLHHWLRSLSPEQYAAYRGGTCAKPKNMSTWGGPDPKITQTDPRSPSARSLQEGLGREQGMQASEKESSETIASWGSGENREEEEEEEGSSSSDSSSGDEDEDWNLRAVTPARPPQGSPGPQAPAELCSRPRRAGRTSQRKARPSTSS